MTEFESRVKRHRREPLLRSLVMRLLDKWINQKPRRKRGEPAPRVNKRHKRSLVGFGLYGILDLLLLVLALLWQRMEVLVLRLLLTVLVVAWIQPFSKRQPWSARQALISWTALLVPGVGSWMAFLWSLQETKPQGAWQDVPVAQTTYRSPIDWGGVLDVVPMIDVLDSPDPVRKKQVLLQVQTMRSPVEVSVVRKALDDADPEVRYYAASLLSFVENRQSGRVRELELRLRANPEDVALWNELADEYREIIRQGIAGAELSRFFLEKRLFVLEHSLSLDPAQANVGLERAQTLFLLDRCDEAEREAKSWLPQGGATADRARAVLIQSAYQRNDQERMSALMADVQDVERLPDEVRETVRFWRRQEGESS